MEYYFIDLFSSFSCIADACPDTCCSGWDILVSGKDYNRFMNMKPGALREYILSHIHKKGQECYFENAGNGDCMMLEPDGLCRIQRETSEEMLCNTCRKYPRIIYKDDAIMGFSMAASCPVVAESLINDAVSFFKQNEAGKKEYLEPGNIPFCTDVLLYAEQMHRERKVIFEDEKKQKIVPEAFERLADLILDRILKENVPKRAELLSLLSYYETERDVSSDFGFFYEEIKERWGKIAGSYFRYRVYSRRLEYPEEKARENYIQVCGELFLFLFLVFLKRMSAPELEKKEWVALMGIMYRFAVHGTERAKKLHSDFLSFCESEGAWDFLIFDYHF